VLYAKIVYVSIYIKYYLFILKYLQMLQEKKVNILKIQSYNNKKKLLLLKWKFSVDPFRSEFIISLAIIGVRHDDAHQSRDTGIAGNCMKEYESKRRLER